MGIETRTSPADDTTVSNWANLNSNCDDLNLNDGMKKLYAVKYADGPVSKQDLGLKGCFSGAGVFITMLLLWLTITILVPVFLLQTDVALEWISEDTTFWVAIGMIGFGVVVLLISLSPVLSLKICKLQVPDLQENMIEISGLEKGTKPPKRLVVICNPNSGAGKSISVLNSIILPLWASEFDLTDIKVEKTKYAGHAFDLCSSYDFSNYDGLIILGGDGSVHEAANGLWCREDKFPVPLGVLPLGTGNNIMLDFGCWDIREAARRIGSGEVSLVDANKVTVGDHAVLSLNTVSWGLPGNASVLSEDFRVLGRHRYLVTGLWENLKLSKEKCLLTFTGADGEETKLDHQDLTMVVINQTQYFGDGMRACPDAVVSVSTLIFEYLS